MKKKRKYTRHKESVQPDPTESSKGRTEDFESSNDGSIPSPVVNGESSKEDIGSRAKNVGSSPTTPTKFKDLPLHIRTSIEKQIEYRKSLNLPDDSEDRKQRAINYFRR